MPGFRCCVPPAIELNPVKASMVSLPEEYRGVVYMLIIKVGIPFGIVNPQKSLDNCGDLEAYLQQVKAGPEADFKRCS